MAPGELTVAGAWLGVLAFTFQIYFDFSGYSDMAVGLGRMLGFEFLPNFNYPYISRSITEFWRRWHISLSTWFREYLYIPLGGNRCSKPRWAFNLFVVWAATGIWHGASWNYLMWGLYFFALLMLEKFFLLRRLERAPALVGHIYTLFLVLVSWAIFALEDFNQLTAYLKVMFGLGGVPLADAFFGYSLISYLPILCVAALASAPLGKSLFLRLPLQGGPQGRVGLLLPKPNIVGQGVHIQPRAPHQDGQAASCGNVPDDRAGGLHVIGHRKGSVRLPEAYQVMGDAAGLRHGGARGKLGISYTFGSHTAR